MKRSFGRATVAWLLAIAVAFAAGCTQSNRSVDRTGPGNGGVSRPAAPAAQPDPHADYYAGVDDSNSAALRKSLHELIKDHRRASYAQCWTILKDADQDPADPTHILDLYGNRSYQKVAGGKGPYNREHSWPKSYGFPGDNSTNYPYTDCHHLFLCNSSYNSSRGNKPYDTCSSACRELPTSANAPPDSGGYPGTSNWTSGRGKGGVFEVWMGRRGDVARALFYMDVRYEGGENGKTHSPEPDLVLTDELSKMQTGAKRVAYMGRLSTLLKWHHEDPVDEKERARNDAVYHFQGNRNPFIDHPEWADCVFSGRCD